MFSLRTLPALTGFAAIAPNITGAATDTTAMFAATYVVAQPIFLCAIVIEFVVKHMLFVPFFDDKFRDAIVAATAAVTDAAVAAVVVAAAVATAAAATGAVSAAAVADVATAAAAAAAVAVAAAVVSVVLLSARTHSETGGVPATDACHTASAMWRLFMKSHIDPANVN